MKQVPPRRCGNRRESGYAIVIVMFFLALLVLAVAAAAPTVLSEIQREREADMVWKGEQYVRGVKLYYTKMHRFPPSLEDLTTAKNGIRFMRQAYKDPMNATDGSWRLIYVGPNGQLIGSLKNRNISFGGQPVMPASASGQAGASNSFGNSSFGSSSFGSSGAPSGSGQQVGGSGATGSGSTDSTDSSSGGSSGQPQTLGQPLGMMDSSNVIGGNIIGVGSKVDKKSFRWYEKAKNYREFEFIWDPSKDLRLGGASRGIGTPIQPGAPGVPVSPASPTQNQNPNGSPDPNGNPPLQAPPPPSN
jgi:hypothetical protein